MDHETARALLHDLAARTLIAAYVEEDGGRALTKVDPITGQAAPPETEPGEIVRAVLQWHGAGWAGEIAAGWHCFVDDQYVFAPGRSSDLREAVDRALAMVDEADAEHPEDAPAGPSEQLNGSAGLAAASPDPVGAGEQGGGDGAYGLRLGSVVLGVEDMQRAASFWSAALGYEPREEHLDPECTVMVDPQGHGVPISLQAPHPVPAEPARLCLGLHTGNPAGQVARLLGLGAQELRDWPYPRDADFVALRDPEGNGFCVIEHAGA